MEFKIKVCREDDESDYWFEPIDRDDVTSQLEAEQYGRNVVDYFNRTLRPHERRRKFISAHIPEEMIL